jgi:hypothetical protein
MYLRKAVRCAGIESPSCACWSVDTRIYIAVLIILFTFMRLTFNHLDVSFFKVIHFDVIEGVAQRISLFFVIIRYT